MAALDDDNEQARLPTVPVDEAEHPPGAAKLPLESPSVRGICAAASLPLIGSWPSGFAGGGRGGPGEVRVVWRPTSPPALSLSLSLLLRAVLGSWGVGSAFWVVTAVVLLVDVWSSKEGRARSLTDRSRDAVRRLGGSWSTFCQQKGHQRRLQDVG